MKHSNKDIIEGKTYSFKLIKLVQLSKNEEFYILKNSSGRKHLLNAEYYKDYGFKNNEWINCRVDKINCSGKIFLEPEHPFHKQGEFYDFEIKNIENKTNKFGEKVLSITVIDALGNNAITNITENTAENYNIGQIINCKVQRIKKGKLYLSHNNIRNKTTLKHGNYYDFIISDIKELNDNKTYYILKDKNNNKYMLDYEFYEDYDFEIGKKIKCSIVKFSSKGYYFLEPQHPYYELNKEYLFYLIKEEKTSLLKENSEYTITVKDIFDKEIKFTNDKSILSNINTSDKIKCKVDGLKKGKALLSFVE
ncbi:MAG: hypothetical protein U9R54_03375 [Bacteroidota bacterium]|nr:hypothetical protein [Bacteroidota bacterium]